MSDRRDKYIRGSVYGFTRSLASLRQAIVKKA